MATNTINSDMLGGNGNGNKVLDYFDSRTDHLSWKIGQYVKKKWDVKDDPKIFGMIRQQGQVAFKWGGATWEECVWDWQCPQDFSVVEANKLLRITISLYIDWMLTRKAFNNITAIHPKVLGREYPGQQTEAF